MSETGQRYITAMRIAVMSVEAMRMLISSSGGIYLKVLTLISMMTHTLSIFKTG